MQPIKAFVAHSFTNEDADVVEVILKCLDRVSALHSRFTWQHAESPEPTVIDAKVLSLLTDKNLLIAICTKKERVIQSASLSRKFYFRKSLIGKEEDFEWKTSDWIIQEIGLAVGRSMKIILLIEEGTRPPGALQGNLERIYFNRETPEKCFDKLLGMIASLTPKVDSASTIQQEVDAQTAKDKEVAPALNLDDWLTPKPDWKKEDYEFALMHFTMRRNSSDAQRINDLFLASAEGKIDTNAQEWASYREYLRIMWGQGGDLARLVQLSANAPANSEIAANLARSYSHYENHASAAITFRVAANAVEDVSEKIYFLGEAALSHQKAGNSAEALELARQLRKLSEENGSGEIEVLKSERNLAEERKENEIEAAALERLLELNPGDDDTRFSLAYKYSDMGRDDLAAYHYSRIPAPNRSAIAWNNLGASLSAIGLPIKAVSAYRKSQQQGETLAMSNLTHKFLEGGFLTEAKEMLDAALKMENHHKNIDKAMGVVENNQEAENRKEDASHEKAKVISGYYRQFGRALAKPTINIVGLWQSPKCTLSISVKGTSVIATGSYERASGLGLIGLAMLGNADGERDGLTPLKYVEDYRGELRGRTIIGSVSRKREGETPKASSILTSTESNPTVLMWLSDAGDKIHVIERQANSEDKHYTLNRL